MNIDIEQIRALADLALEKNLSELKVEEGETSVTIKTVNAAAMVVQQPAPVAFAPTPVSTGVAPEAKASKPPVEESNNLHTITAPMVGTFYKAPSPDSPPFVEAGQRIAKGQTLCIIEAMKLMNELEAEVEGKIVKILIENGQSVEFGQPLFLLDPNG